MDQNKSFPKKETKLLTGMFTNRESTDQAYNSLQERGYTNEEINLVMSDDTRTKHFSIEANENEVASKVIEGAEIGSAIGGTVGLIVGVIAILGTSLIIPGIGVLFAGPIAIVIAAAGAAAITGGVLGALMGIGIPEERAKLYETGIKNGNIVIGVHPRNIEDAAYFQTTWSSLKGAEIHY